jgi:hypothetical protein
MLLLDTSKTRAIKFSPCPSVLAFTIVFAPLAPNFGRTRVKVLHSWGFRRLPEFTSVADSSANGCNTSIIQGCPLANGNLAKKLFLLLKLLQLRSLHSSSNRMSDPPHQGKYNKRCHRDRDPATQQRLHQSSRHTRTDKREISAGNSSSSEFLMVLLISASPP